MAKLILYFQTLGKRNLSKDILRNFCSCYFHKSTNFI